MNDRYSVLRQPDWGRGGSFAYTGTAALSGAMAPGSSAVLFWCTTDAFVRTTSKAAGTLATTADVPVPGGTLVVLPLNQANDSDERKLSAIQISGAGTCYYCPLT